MRAALARALVLGLALTCMVSAPACTSGVGLAAPRAMNHPVDVAFACFDTSVVGLPVVRPLADCALNYDVSTNTRSAPTVNAAFHMHALVTQMTRGEVGAVDLLARTVLDSDQSVPGYTFVPVGELPTRIVVPPRDPTCTYVASRGPVDGRHPGISIIDTRRFRSGAGLDHNPFPLHAPFVLPSAPSDMVISPDGGALWLALDSVGVLVRVPIVGSCQLGAIDQVVPLFEDVPAGVPAGATADTTRVCGLTTPVPPATVMPRNPDVSYSTVEPEPVAIEIDVENGLLLVADRGMPLIHRVRLADGTLTTPIATGVPVRDVVATPRVPDSYALDPDPACAGGFVPAAGVTFSRYLYAIDDTDGTVLAVEYTDETAATFGSVLPVDVRGSVRPDRIPMPVVARALAIVTPSYDRTAADPRVFDRGPGCDQIIANPEGYGLCLPSDPATNPPPSPSLLRGVFLVIAATDGSIRFVDVYDLDAPCRGREFGAPTSTADCTSPTVNGDIAVYIRRHRPRTQQLLTAFVTLTTPPGIQYPAGGTQTLEENGRPTGVPDDQTVPALSVVADPTTGACPAGMSSVWGDPSPIVCSLIDPFAATGETWAATYEGVIPGTQTSSANAVLDASGAFTGEIRTRVDYCLRGVIGATDAVDAATLPANGTESNYTGDMLAITGALPTTATDDRAVCRWVAGINTVGETLQPVLVRFDRAFSTPPDLSEPYTGRLVLDPNATLEHREQGFLTGADCTMSSECVDATHPRNFCDPDGHCRAIPTIADAVSCFGDTLLTVEVRSYAAFTVTGTRTGYQSRIVRDDTDGHCRYDGTLDPLRQGHAYVNVLYQNGRVAFQPTGVSPGDPATELIELRFTVTTGFSQLGADLSLSSTGVRSMALPSIVRYSPEMRALYAIETERRGLIEMTLRPFALTSTSYQ